MRWVAVAGAVLLVAFGLRVAYVAVTPDYAIVHDARDYDVHAQSVARGEGFSERLTGKPTAFRPPGYVYLLGGAYKLFDAQSEPDRIRVARWLGIVLGTLAVALIGGLALQLWGRTAALVAMALAAVYVPSVLVATAIMSEQLFVVLMLAALVVAIAARGRWPMVVAAGFLAGLAVLTRANGLILLAPLAFAVWPSPRRSWKSLGPPAVLVAVALVTVAPWTVRNARELRAFVPVTTQLGWALAGTYNSDARGDTENPASWRSVRRVSDYRAIARLYPTTPEAEMEGLLRRASLEWIRDDQRHPRLVGRRRDLLLALRRAGARGRDARADARLRVGGAACDVPQRDPARGRDAALPRRARSVLHPAGRARGDRAGHPPALGGAPD